MTIKEEIQDVLSRGGYSEEDIRLGFLLSQRAAVSYMATTTDITTCVTCLNMGGVMHRPIAGVGPVNSPLMIITDSPGEQEMNTLIPYIGPEASLLSMILAKQGIDRNAMYMTYASKTRIDRELKPSELMHLREHFLSELDAVNPKVILTLGASSMRLVRGKYDLTMQNARGHFVTDIATRTGKKAVEAVHTYSLRNVIEPSENRSAFKKAIWNDVRKAVETVRALRPQYVYDRVGLDRIKGR